VAAQFHRHAFGDAGAHHVPDGRSAKVVRDAAGTAGGDPGAAPRMVEAAGRDRMMTTVFNTSTVMAISHHKLIETADDGLRRSVQ
jgi:hypothetical protein